MDRRNKNRQKKIKKKKKKKHCIETKKKKNQTLYRDKKKSQTKDKIPTKKARALEPAYRVINESLSYVKGSNTSLNQEKNENKKRKGKQSPIKLILRCSKSHETKSKRKRTLLLSPTIPKQSPGISKTACV
jgi:hypothetical protein